MPSSQHNINTLNRPENSVHSRNSTSSSMTSRQIKLSFKQNLRQSQNPLPLGILPNCNYSAMILCKISLWEFSWVCKYTYGYQIHRRQCFVCFTTLTWNKIVLVGGLSANCWPCRSIRICSGHNRTSAESNKTRLVKWPNRHSATFSLQCGSVTITTHILSTKTHITSNSSARDTHFAVVKRYEKYRISVKDKKKDCILWSWKIGRRVWSLTWVLHNIFHLRTFSSKIKKQTQINVSCEEMNDKQLYNHREMDENIIQ